MNKDELNRIGQYHINDIKRATVIVIFNDSFGKERLIPFSFRGETFDDGEHLKLYMNKKDVQAFPNIDELQNPLNRGETSNIYRFHKEDVYVKEDNIYYE